jgi:hypothetical protein
MKPKKVKVKKGKNKVEVDEEIIDPETIDPRMKDESGEFLDLGGTLGFLIGVGKRLISRIEQLENANKQLALRISFLESKIGAQQS